MAIVIDELEIDIQKKGSDASGSLDALNTSFKKLNATLNRTKDGVSALQKFSNAMNELDNAISRLSDANIKKVKTLADSMTKLALASRNIKGLGSVRKSIEQVGKAISEDSTGNQKGSKSAEFEAMTSLEEMTEAQKEFMISTIQLERLSPAGVFRNIKEQITASLEPLKKLGRMVGRIAIYRVLRTILKDISEAFSEGLSNAYQFSKQSESFTRLADTLDRIKSITSQMVNQLGALLGELKQATLPLVERIVELVRNAATHITEWLAAMNGADTYLVAEYVATEWAEAEDALKKYKGQLLGLDELNNLTESKSSSSTSGVDYSTLYKEAEVNPDLKWLGTFKVTFDSLLFDGKKMDEDSVLEDVIDTLNVIVGGVIGFMYGGVSGAIIGSLTGLTLTAFFKTLKIKADENGQKGITHIGLAIAMGALCGGLIGYKVGGLKGAAVGATIGSSATAIISYLKFRKDTNGSSNLNYLPKVVGALVGGLIAFKLGDTKDALLFATIGSTVLSSISLLDFEDGKVNNYQTSMNMLASVLGGVMGGLIGFKYLGGNLNGVVMGISIGSCIGTLIKNMLEPTDKTSGQFKNEKFLELIKETLGGILGAAIAVAVTGNGASAALGFTIGATLALEFFDLSHDLGSKIKQQASNVLGNNSMTVTTSGGSKIDLNPTTPFVESAASDATVAQRMQNLWDGIKETFSKFGFHTKANGGVVSNGTLFFAGEAGAEFVGNIGNTSAVANTDQMTDILKSATYAGVTAALADSNVFGGIVPATADDVYFAMKKASSKNSKMTGALAW